TGASLPGYRSEIHMKAKIAPAKASATSVMIAVRAPLDAPLSPMASTTPCRSACIDVWLLAELPTFGRCCGFFFVLRDFDPELPMRAHANWDSIQASRSGPLS